MPRDALSETQLGFCDPSAKKHESSKYDALSHEHTHSSPLGIKRKYFAGCDGPWWGWALL